MSRTGRAALVAAVATGGFVFLMGWFLGFDPFWSGLVGIAVGALAAGLIHAADIRSRAVETRVQPRFPGPPEPADPDDDDEDA